MSALAGLCLLAYAAPLFWPPASTPPIPPAEAWLLERLYPGVPALWVGVRLLALFLGAVLLAPRAGLSLPDPFGNGAHSGRPALARRALALVVAIVVAVSARWAGGFGPAGQVGYLLALALPALVLARPGAWRWPSVGAVIPVVAVIAVWMGLRLATDPGAPRVADAVDAWRAVVDIVLFVTRGKNVLTDLLDAELPGLGAVLLVFQGIPLFQAGLVAPGIRAVQVQQIVWVAVSAAGVAALAGTVVGRRTAVVATAVFLFAPYTRFVALVPGPFLAGPLYGVALGLCALVAVRGRSEAALAALGACAGIALTYPGVVPVAGLCVALTVWALRGEWRTLWAGWATALVAFAAALAPALGSVLVFERMGQHFQLHGGVTLLEGGLLGQLPVAAFAEARATIVWRPLDIVAGALLEPFANPRTAIRLWGDAIFDPVGAALTAIGLVACVAAVLRSAGACVLLLFFLAALSPAFVSPVDRVDIVHAVAIPVAVAVLAAAGWAAVERRLDAARRRASLVAVVVAIAAGGTLLFDAVNPRILSASAPGVMFRVLVPGEAQRAAMLDYPKRFSPDVRWLFTGPMTAYAGARPVGFLEYGGGPLPLEGLAAEGRDLLFWSPGLEADLHVTAALCAQAPASTLYELHDAAGLGRVFAARVGGPEWQPRAPAGRWRRRTCEG